MGKPASARLAEADLPAPAVLTKPRKPWPSTRQEVETDLPGAFSDGDKRGRRQ